MSFLIEKTEMKEGRHCKHSLTSFTPRFPQLFNYEFACLLQLVLKRFKKMFF